MPVAQRALWPRLAELELDDVRIPHIDLAHGRKQRGARDTYPGGGPDDALVGGLDIFRREHPAIMEGHTLAQQKGVGLLVGRDLPTMREVRDNRLSTVARIAANQVVIHAALGTHVGRRARLMHVKVRWGTQHAVAQHPPHAAERVRGPAR